MTMERNTGFFHKLLSEFLSKNGTAINIIAYIVRMTTNQTLLLINLEKWKNGSRNHIGLV